MSERLRRNNKKIMAVLVVFLMIVFVVDMGLRRDGGDDGASQVIGHLGDAELTGADIRQAQTEWNLLTRGELGRFTSDSLAMLLMEEMGIQGQDFMAQFTAMRSGQQVAGQLDEMTYLLLVKEAERLGIALNRDQVEQMRTRLASVPSADPETRERAVLNWLNVREVFHRMSRAAKVSPAMALRAVAEQQQQVALEVIPFSAADFKGQVGSPTPEQLQAFFQKHRDVDAETNEFGIGYRFPDRVQVEYVRIPKEAIAKTITDEDIYKHWKDNQSSFQRPPDTQPTTIPANEPLGPSATMPATAPTTVASTQPTTRPWTEVKDQIRDFLANQRASAMASAINQTFRADWPTFREAVKSASASATQPSNAPTSLGVPYNTYVYLQRLQNKIQNLKESRGVLPELVSEPNLLTRRDLENLPGIGRSRVLTPDGRPIPFAQFAIDNAEAFMTDAERKQAQEAQLQTLALYQPSPPFRDEVTGNYYIFRLTAAEAAHPAQSLDVVESRVREDWLSTQAYEKAKEAARQFLEQAKSQGLAAAAGDRKVISTGLFKNDPNLQTLPTYTLSPQATRKLVEGGFNLLSERVRTGNEHPVGVIDLPRAFTSVVARLAEATPATKDEFFAVQVQQTQQMLEFQRVHQMMYKWFNPEAVAERVKYKPTDAAPDPRPTQQPAPPPIFPGA